MLFLLQEKIDKNSDEVFLVSLLRICLLAQVISPKSHDGLTSMEGWAGDVASLIQCKCYYNTLS